MKKIDMYNFIKEHYMFFFFFNYWYSEKTISKNVKLYNLNLTDWCKALEILELDNWYTINRDIEVFENEHNGVEVYFNGRSGGYLILKDKDAIMYQYHDFLDNTYEDYLKDCKKYIDYGYTQKDLTKELKRQYDLVKEFDKLCDDLEEEVQFLIDNYDIVEEEITIPQTIRRLELRSEE